MIKENKGGHIKIVPPKKTFICLLHVQQNGFCLSYSLRAHDADINKVNCISRQSTFQMQDSCNLFVLLSHAGRCRSGRFVWRATIGHDYMVIDILLQLNAAAH